MVLSRFGGSNAFDPRIQLAGQLNDQDVISSTVLVDSDLFFSVQANHIYSAVFFQAFEAGFTGDLDFAYTVPVGTTGQHGFNDAATVDLGVRLLSSGSGAGVERQLRDWVWLWTTNAGILQHQFAQDVSEAVNTRLLRGSNARMWDFGLVP